MPGPHPKKRPLHPNYAHAHADKLSLLAEEGRPQGYDPPDHSKDKPLHGSNDASSLQLGAPARAVWAPPQGNAEDCGLKKSAEWDGAFSAVFTLMVVDLYSTC